MNSKRPLLVSVSAIFLACSAIHPVAARAASIVVSNCNDSGIGSLRSAIAMAPSGATIDLRRLACGRIALTRGQLAIPQRDLTLLGPGASRLTLDGNGQYRVLRHLGAGTLRVTSLSITNGINRSTTAYGGCIRSQGSIELRHSTVHHCKVLGGADANPETPFARGGGIYASADVRLWYSRVHANTARSDGGLGALGGGISAGRDVLLVHSRIDANSAVSTGSGDGGGVFAFGLLVMHRTRMTQNHASSYGAAADTHGGIRTSYSLIDHNTAPSRAGLMTSQHADIVKTTISDNVSASGAALAVTGTRLMNYITQSTISGNTGGTVSGAFFEQDVTIFNSTIAFNRGSEATPCEAAVYAFSPYLESVIAAKNDCENDIAYAYEPNATNSIVGSPAGLSESFSADPRLAPLAYYGGLVPVHALFFDSPAIDRGTNYLDLPYDQRGPGFARVKGLQPDIGAFER